MKILICTDSFYPGVGGTEAACVGFANALVEAGHDVVLACPSYGKIERDDSVYKFDVIRLPSVKLTKNDYAVLANLQIGKLKKKLREKNFVPDIIHTETASGMTKIGLALGKKWGVPVIMTIHTKFKDAFEDSVGKTIASWMIKSLVRKFNRADKVVTVVKNMKEEIRSYGFDGEVLVINNGAMFKKNSISPEKKIELRKNLGFEANDKILLFCGRIVAYKRIDFVLRSFKKAVEKGLDGKLVLIGEGEDETNLKNLVQNLDLQNKVVFTGVLKDRKLVEKFYQISDLFVTASIFDTDPIVVVEAASCKVPSLVIENTGCSGRIKDGFNGFTAKNDEENFSDKMVEIFSKDFSEISQNALDTIPTTWAQTVEKHMPIYDDLIKISARKKVERS